MGSSDIQGELWGRAPRHWAEIQDPMHIPLWEVMLDQGMVGDQTRILDAGCGSAGASVLAAARGARVSGIDASSSMIEIALERHPEGSFRVGDIQELPYENASFDAVLASNCLQYAQSPAKTLGEFKRVCTTDGRVVVALWSTPEKVQYRVVFDAIRGCLPDPPPSDGQFELSAPGVLDGLMERAGLTVLGSGEVLVDYDYPDIDTLWRVNTSAGPFQSAFRFVGRDKLREAVAHSVKPFTASDGSIHMGNAFRYVTATT